MKLSLGLDVSSTMSEVPSSLRRWFVVHCFADVAFAVPLFVAPQTFLGALGWTAVDPFTTRIAAAALLGVGLESYLGKDQDLRVFAHMLNLKVIWSLACVVGIALSIAQGAQGRPPMAYGFLAIFVGFHAVWVHYRRIVGRALIAAAKAP